MRATTAFRIAVTTALFAGGLSGVTSSPVAASSFSSFEVAGGGTVTFGAGEIQPLVPSRVLDTREGNGAPVGKVGPGTTTILQIAGRGGVPLLGAGAVVLNVVATDPSADGFVTVYPTGVERPVASNLNIVTGETVPNLVVVKLGVGGTVSLFNLSGSTHLIADVAGWFPESSGLQPMTPTRLLDTREGNGAPTGRAGPGTTTTLQVTGRGGIPASGVGAVVLNVTVTAPTASGYVTVSPTGVERPLASNLNFTPGLTVPNLVIAKVGTSGAVNLFNSAGNTHLIADVAGWFPSTSTLVAISPTRLLDTREGNGAPAGAVGSGSTTALQVTGRNGIPASGVGAVIINVTVTAPTADGFITVYPAGVDRPTASNLNMRPGQTVPNLVIAKVGDGGVINLFNSAGTSHLVADVVGWFPAAGTNATTLDLNVGTVLAGAGDVISFTGNSDVGGTVTLSGSADVPPVGGHLAVSPHPTVPQGLFGKATGVATNAEGTVTVTFVPAILEDGFADIQSSFAGAVTADASLQSERLQRIEATAECTTSGGLSIQPTISVSAGDVTFEYDLSDRYILFDLPIVATVGLSATFTGALSCTIGVPEYPIPIPFATVSATPQFSLTVSGGLTTTATLSSTVHFGFEADGSNVTNLSSFTPTASGDVDAAISATITFRPSIQVKLQLFGIAGGFVDLGINFTGTVEPLGLPCASLSYQLTLDFGFALGKWGLEWNITLASIQGPTVTVYAKTEGCAAGDHAWVGSIDVVYNQDLTTEQLRDTSGDIYATYTLDRDFSYRIESTTTSLVNRTVYSAQAPDDVTVDFRSYNQTDTYHERGLPDASCNSHYSVAHQTPWSFFTELVDDPVIGNLVDSPEDGDTVYLLVAPFLTVQNHCRDGETDPGWLGATQVSPGDEYDVDLDCLNGAFAAGQRGYCFLPVIVSDDGTRLTFSGTLSGNFDYNAIDTPATETVTIDLRRISV